MLRLASLLLTLALCPLRSQGQSETTLEDNASYRKGLAALADHLPELAIAPLTDALSDFSEDAGATTTIQVKLGEARVRAGRLEEEPKTARTHGAIALRHLATAADAGNEDAIFWAAQAHILRAELTLAAGLFARLHDAEDPRQRTQALLSRAHLLSALGDPRAAGRLLTELGGNEDPEIAQEAKLLHATILLQQDQPTQAAALLGNPQEDGNRKRQVHSRFLQAQILARTEKSQAMQAFRAIVDDPGPAPHLLRHSAQVSLAGCMQETGEPEKAIETLINLIDTHPRTPLMGAAFHRLANWAVTESLKSRVEQQFSAWANLTGDETPSEPGPGEIILSPDTAARSGYALYYYSIALGQRNNANSNQKAQTLLTWFIKNMPRHPSNAAATLELAKLQIAAQRKEEAIATLEGLNASTTSIHLRETTGRLLGRLKFEQEEFQGAATAFLRARDSLATGQEDVSAVNAGVSLLRAGDATGFSTLIQSLDDAETRATLLLERALYQSSNDIGDARLDLERFLRNHPDHSRVPEARLAMAEEHLRLDPSRESAHRQVMEELRSLEAGKLGFHLDLRRLLIHLRLSGLTDNWEPAIAASKRFLKAYKPDRIGPMIQLKISEAYFQNGNLNEAQGRFQEIANTASNQTIEETALYYAARAALKLNTVSSREEARSLLQRVIEDGGPLSVDARLLLAHSQVEGQAQEAITILQPLLAAGSPARLDALMLTADAHRELGTPNNLRAALGIYDQVLATPEIAYPLSNRLFWLKGQVFEELGESRPALDTYYHVIRRENLPESEQPSEWYYFSRCAFDAVEILEQGALPRWDAAVEILRKVENSESPWRGEAGRRRAEIQLEHQLFNSD